MSEKDKLHYEIANGLHRRRLDALREQNLLLRKRSGLTQKQLAEKLGCTAAYLSYIEKGQRIPSVEFMLKLKDALGRKRIAPLLKVLDEVE